ncbi:ThiF family adenylyltransferase, partial [Klebsiella pneumoniae]|uniref:ThiF family adenylyltransferase n=1 Tax=Klebsiella pneumoniae TaxID=573 RepID=UPI0038554DFE
LGSNLVESLARQGYTQIKVVDFDRVETHNINNQVYTEQDVGGLKVKALQARVFISTKCELDIMDKRLEEGNAKKFFKDATLV